MMPSGTASSPPPDADGLNAILQEFCADADVAFCALVDGSGMVIESASPRGLAPRQLSEIGALAAAAFAATSQLSARLGEHGAEGLCQMGERWHYYLCPLAGKTVLLSVFDSESLVGLVKAALARTRDGIVRCLEMRIQVE
jgi:predicted regulator of Ras-like GTPase activity (Roadblock/LC7/MglB family)